jgi:hypothetical protein
MCADNSSGATGSEGAASLKIKIGFLGVPDSVDGRLAVQVPWTRDTVDRMKRLGFNTVQLNVAWGSRPDDEPLNLEDIVELDEEQDRAYPQVVPLRCQPGPEAREKRRNEIRNRIALCRDAGLRTLFHFGAPYNAHCRYGDGPPNCLMDPKVLHRYELLLDAFARDFPGVNDILVYTYDQDAWLCSEFGPCPRCLGIPLAERVTPFLEGLAARWKRHSPDGRLWWEPWELSAGQVLACVEQLCPESLGLALHCNIAEVMGTLPVDRWLKNTASIAARRGVPVVVEYWLGGACEELETFYRLAHPLVTLRGLRAITSVPGVCGVKEYFGLNPTVEDPNLRMTGLFFENPMVSEEAALRSLAKPYGPAADGMVAFWRLTSEGMELFPWETSWFIREIGRSRTDHSLSAAMLRGQQCHTPSWDSTRAAIFMKTDDRQPDPWMLEDVQTRCQLAVTRWQAALNEGNSLKEAIPAALAHDFEQNLADLSGLVRRALAYVYHLRQTNLATVLRRAEELGLERPKRVVDELLAVLEADLENHRSEVAASGPGGMLAPWREMEDALDLLREDTDKFLMTYLREEPGSLSKGFFSLTSR